MTDAANEYWTQLTNAENPASERYDSGRYQVVHVL